METNQKNDAVEDTLKEEPIVKKVSIWKEIVGWIIPIILGLAFAFFLAQYIIVNARIPTGSMMETIQPGDRLFGSRIAYWKEEPERFDIIIFSWPDDEEDTLIKRIIGLPGETVNIIDGKVYIDDSEVPLDDSFIREPMIGSFGPFVVPQDSYFVLGDNRNNSKDSRFWDNKFVHKDQIIGKALFRYWPFDRFGKIE